MSEISKTFKPSTLWSKFSMISKCLQIKENINASRFPKTLAFLKRQSSGYEPKKSKVFTAEQVSEFMTKASDGKWLLDKVILSLGIFGACRRDDILNLNKNDVNDNGSYFTVKIRDDKTHKNRFFTISDDDCPFQPCQLLRKYMLLRPAHAKNDKFLVCYRNGKCAAQNVGIHRIGSVPKNVATFLKLENPETYTGHALRRSSATMIVEGGADLLALKQHGGWKSSSVAEGYVENSIKRKIEVSKKLFAKVNTSFGQQNIDVNEQKTDPDNEYFTIDDIFSNDERNATQISNQTLHLLQKQLPNKGINVMNNENCTINIHLNLDKK
jgi:integrase